MTKSRGIRRPNPMHPFCQQACRRCNQCGKVKPLVREFYPVKRRGSQQWGYTCKPCSIVVAGRRKERVGKTVISLARHELRVEDYEMLKAAQGGGCAICGASTFAPGSDWRLAVDHDHGCCPGSSGCIKCVRGLLCNACNRGLGFFEDSAERLFAAAQYLAQPHTIPIEGIPRVSDDHVRLYDVAPGGAA